MKNYLNIFLKNLGFETLHMLMIIAIAMVATLAKHDYIMTSSNAITILRPTMLASFIGTSILTAPIAISLTIYCTKNRTNLWENPNLRWHSLIRVALSMLISPLGIIVGGKILSWPMDQIIQTSLASLVGILSISGIGYFINILGINNNSNNQVRIHVSPASIDQPPHITIYTNQINEPIITHTSDNTVALLNPESRIRETRIIISSAQNSHNPDRATTAMGPRS